MDQPLHEISLWAIFITDLVFNLGRYVIIAGVAYVLFYLLFRRWLVVRKIQQRFPKLNQIRREVLYSLSSLVIFALTAVVVAWGARAGWMKLYVNPAQYGWWYLGFSLIALIFIHDTWFYWTHRLMHWRPLFRTMHAVHHRSHSPTPWAAFAFHPTEAITHTLMIPLLLLVMPLHVGIIALWLIYMTVMNVGGHLGFEILPRWFVRNPVTAWHNTSVHHDMHHQHFRYNFGLYYNIWDRLMGTNHPAYEDEYDRITGAVPKNDTSADAPADGTVLEG